MNLLQLTFKYNGSTDYLKAFADLVSGNWSASRPGIRKLVKGLVDQTLPLADDATNGPTAIQIQLGGVAASATGTFTGQPSANDTITLGGTAITAKNSGAVNNEFNIGSTTQETVQNLVAAINASTTAAISKTVYATYADNSTVKATGTITFTGLPSNNETITVNGVVFTAKTSGATGNQFNIGSTTSETVDNFIDALNATNSAGVFGEMTFAKTVNTGTKATGVLTLTGDPSNNDTFTVNGVVFTAKTSGATGNQFNISAGDTTATAAAIVTAWNASATVATQNITASSALGVVTFEYDTAGIVGNSITTVESMSNATFAGATMTGGADNVVITCTASQAGTVGNAYTLAESATNVSVSGANFTGGIDAVTVVITAKQSGLIGNYYTVTESMNNFTVTGSGKLAGGTASDYYTVGPGGE